MGNLAAMHIVVLVLIIVITLLIVAGVIAVIAWVIRRSVSSGIRDAERRRQSDTTKRP